MKCVAKVILIFCILNLLNNYTSGLVNTKPNIILIVGDDIGWNDFGFHGSNQFETPNIDALAYNGIILNRYYSEPACTPSRAALLTGNYPIRSGMQGFPLNAGENRSLPENMPTLPEVLKKEGYSTHLVGKWHLGAASRNHTALRKGFDTHFGYYSGFIGYFNYKITQDMPEDKDHPPDQKLDGFDLWDEFKPQWQYSGEYATDLFTNKSLDVIRSQANKSQPFFLMVSHLAAHTGHDGCELGVPDEEEVNRKYHYINNTRRRKYAEIVNLLDKSVGLIVNELSVTKQLENTIIVFITDNGAPSIGMYSNEGSNWPFRGIKFTNYEGGIRGTGIIYSPILNRNYIYNNLFHITDFFPTLIAATGSEKKDNLKMDGINLWTDLKTGTGPKRSSFLCNIDEVLNYSAIVSYDGKYKLVNGSYNNGTHDDYYGDDGRGAENPPYNYKSIFDSPVNKATNRFKLTEDKINKIRSKLDLSFCRKSNEAPKIKCGWCLFDLNKDPCETTNIFKANPEIASELQAKLAKFYREIVPQTNKKVDWRSDPRQFNNTWDTWLDYIHEEL